MTNSSDDYTNSDPYSITLGDWDETNTITIDSSLADGALDITQPFGTDVISFDDIFSTPPSITIGKTTLTEEKVQIMEALFEAIESLPADNELKSMFDTVRMMRKIKNED